MDHLPFPEIPLWLLIGDVSFNAGTEEGSGIQPLLQMQSISRGEVFALAKFPPQGLSRKWNPAAQISAGKSESRPALGPSLQ